MRMHDSLVGVALHSFSNTMCSPLLLILMSFLPPIVEPVNDYSTSWVLEIEGGSDEAERLASAHGFSNRGSIGSLHNKYHFKLKEECSKQPMPHKTAALLLDDKVQFAEQQVVRSHVKRDYVVPNDPGWQDQWSLKNTGQLGAGSKKLDSRVEQAWLQGYTGRGVMTAVIDDGLEWRHNDLIDNYDAELSYDCVSEDGDPTPSAGDNHGTECAGVIAMSKNSHCGIGVAFQSKIGGLRIQIEVSLDVYEALALGYKQENIHIYSNSWGPTDNGFTVEGLGPLVTQTFENGAQQGRDGRGNIYVWAAGNGGDNFDSCAADGFVNSIYTIAVGSADQNGEQAFYDEDCSAKMAVTFSYNSASGPQMYTTIPDGQCTDKFTGTSASAPLASGVIALVLEANPDLTWRDVQYLIVYTSNPDILTVDDLATNGAGLRFSHHFGFGAIDAEAMVTRARHWINVPEQQNFTIPATPPDCFITNGTACQLNFEFTSDSDNSSNSLEHVIVTLSLSITNTTKLFNLTDYNEAHIGDDSTSSDKWLRDPHPRRGDVRLELTSPSGTMSVLLPYRDYDFVNDVGYDGWPFMSVHFWGENPVGTWTLLATFRSSSGAVYVGNVSLTAFGVNGDLANIAECSNSSYCLRGCPEVCDVCPELRNNLSLTCVSVCPNTTTEYNGYCIDGDVIYPHTTDAGIGTTVVVLVSVSCILVAILTAIAIVVLIVALIMRRRRKRSRNFDMTYALVNSEVAAQV